jgi:hypothetical protein
MHYQVKVDPLAGFVAHAVAPGQVFAMCVSGFFTTDDGSQFYSKLEAIQNLVLGPYIAATLRQLQVDFATDEACADYVAVCRWPDGFSCPPVQQWAGIRVGRPTPQMTPTSWG